MYAWRAQTENGSIFQIPDVEKVDGCMLLAYNCMPMAYNGVKMVELTANKADLLRLFFTNPEKAFYVQQIGRLLGKKPGVFQKALKGLERQGILTSEYVGNLRYFRANKDYALYDEFKRIVFKTVGVAGGVGDALAKLGGIHLAFIYGSYAKGGENLLSDIDVVIVGKPDEDLLIKSLDKLENKLARQVNYRLYSPAEYAAQIRKKEPFLARIMKEKRLMLIGRDDGPGKVRKRESGEKAAT